jgi:hypothetical protein
MIFVVLRADEAGVDWRQTRKIDALVCAFVKSKNVTNFLDTTQIHAPNKP